MLLEQLPQIGDVVGASGAERRPCGSGRRGMWALGPLPRPLAPYVHICHHFGPYK
jgi:hypothetical protein